MLVNDGYGIFAGIRGLACQEFIHDDSEAINIRARIDLITPDLFW